MPTYSNLIDLKSLAERQPAPRLKALRTIAFKQAKIKFFIIAVPAPLDNHPNNIHYLCTGQCVGGFAATELIVQRNDIQEPLPRDLPIVLNLLEYYTRQALALLTDIAERELHLKPDPHIYLNTFFRGLELKGFPFSLLGLRDFYTDAIKRSWR